MKKLLHLLLAGLLLVTTAATAAAPYANNRAPLREKPFAVSYTHLTLPTNSLV